MTRTWLGSARADRCFGLTEIFALTPAPARSTARSTDLRVPRDVAGPDADLVLPQFEEHDLLELTGRSHRQWRLVIGPAVGDDDAGPGIALAAHRDPFAIDGLVVTRAVDLEGG